VNHKERPLVLLVEREPAWCHLLSLRMKNKVRIVGASSVQDARRLFAEHIRELSAILVSVRMPEEKGEEPTDLSTEDLVRYMRQGFRGPIVAVSDVRPELRLALLDAGCNFASTKSRMHHALAQSLNIDIT